MRRKNRAVQTALKLVRDPASCETAVLPNDPVLAQLGKRAATKLMKPTAKISRSGSTPGATLRAMLIDSIIPTDATVAATDRSEVKSSIGNHRATASGGSPEGMWPTCVTF